MKPKFFRWMIALLILSFILLVFAPKVLAAAASALISVVAVLCIIACAFTPLILASDSKPAEK